jgi:DNA-binding NarL/FixJ family response regulator
VRIQFPQVVGNLFSPIVEEAMKELYVASVGDGIRQLPVGKSEKICILVVDDHDRVRALLREWLEIVLPQCTVIEAGTGEDAVILARAVMPNVVIMDLRLPQMSGIEATRLIKEAEPAIQVVMLTDHDDEMHRAEAAAAGASDYVPKQLMQVSLLPTLMRLLTTQNGTEWQRGPI